MFSSDINIQRSNHSRYWKNSFKVIKYIYILFLRITFKYDFLAPPRESLPRQLRAETSMNKLGSSAADEFLEEGQDGTTHPETEVLW